MSQDLNSSKVIELPRVLYPSKRKGLVLLAAGTILVLGGIWMVIDGDDYGWLFLLFFALLTIGLAINLHPQASFLQLDERGFTFASLFRRHSLLWTDVEELVVTQMPHGKMVGWNFSPSYAGSRRGASLSSGLAGCEAALPDTYGMSAEKLCAFMNRIQEQTLGNRKRGVDVSEHLRCMACNSVQDPSAKFCADCGKPLHSNVAEKGVCPECHCRVDDDTRFCGECGTAMHTDAT